MAKLLPKGRKALNKMLNNIWGRCCPISLTVHTILVTIMLYTQEVAATYEDGEWDFILLRHMQGAVTYLDMYRLTMLFVSKCWKDDSLWFNFLLVITNPKTVKNYTSFEDNIPVLRLATIHLIIIHFNKGSQDKATVPLIMSCICCWNSERAHNNSKHIHSNITLHNACHLQRRILPITATNSHLSWQYFSSTAQILLRNIPCWFNACTHCSPLLKSWAMKLLYLCSTCIYVTKSTSFESNE